MKISSSLNIELQIVGGSLSSPLELEMKDEDNIKQLGYISDKSEMSQWLKQVDVYVQPSFTEGFPFSVIEAMSFAIPCIGSNVGGIPELVNEDYLFKAGSHNKIMNYYIN